MEEMMKKILRMILETRERTKQKGGQNYLNNDIENTPFGTGLLKSGKSAVHQELHIDDRN
jgi:hypothetical protein